MEDDGSRIPPYSSVFLRMQRLRNIIRSSPLAPVARRIYRRITLLLIRVLLSRRRVPKPADENRDTFVFGNDHLGDVVVRLPFLDALSRRARGRSGRMVVVVAPAYADFMRRTGVADHVIALSREETLSLYQWRRVRRLLHRELAPFHFREAVNSIHMGHLPQDDLFMTAISAQESFGSFDPVFQNYAVLDSSHLPYGHFYRYDRAMTVHGNDREYCRFITGEAPKCREVTSFMPRLTEEEQAALPRIPDCCYAIVPGAQAAFRRWPTAKFATVCNWLLERDPHVHVAILGSKDEAPLASAVIGEIGDKSRMVDLTGRTSILQLGAILPRFRLVVSNETGTAHFAMMLGVPVISILGGGHYGGFEPNPQCRTEHCVTVDDHRCFRCGWHCSKNNDISQPHPCIAGITTEQVITAICNAEAKA